MGQLALVRDVVFRRHALGAALELAGLRIQALQRAKLLIAPKPGFAHRGFQHADRFIIHPHYGSKRLELEGMGEPAQELVAAVVMNDGLARDRAKARHAVREPSRHMATVQRQIGAARPASHQQFFLCSASVSIMTSVGPGKRCIENVH
jgi:hypothetical protein